MTTEPRWFIVCSVCLGWGRTTTYEPDGWHRTTGACPECAGSGEEQQNQDREQIAA